MPPSSPCSSSPTAAGSTSSATSWCAGVSKTNSNPAWKNSNLELEATLHFPFRTCFKFIYLDTISPTQREYYICSDRCEPSLCSVNFGGGDSLKDGRSLVLPPSSNGSTLRSAEAAFSQPPEDGALLASYSVFVLEPGADLGKETQQENKPNRSFRAFSPLKIILNFVFLL